MKKSMCDLRGHHWRNTTSDTVLVCSEKSCRHIAILKNGRIEPIDRKVKSSLVDNIEQEAESIAHLYQQIQMWEREENRK